MNIRSLIQLFIYYAFLGKTMENVRKRRVIDLVTTPENLRKLVAKPTFKAITVFHKDLSAIERMKTKVMRLI